MKDEELQNRIHAYQGKICDWIEFIQNRIKETQKEGNCEIEAPDILSFSKYKTKTKLEESFLPDMTYEQKEEVANLIYDDINSTNPDMWNHPDDELKEYINNHICMYINYDKFPHDKYEQYVSEITEIVIAMAK